MLKTFLFSIITIVIIHLFIRYLLQNDKLYKLNSIVTEAFTESQDKSDEMNCGCGKTPCITYGKEELSITSKANKSDEIDLNKMKTDLMNYIISDKEMYNGTDNEVSDDEDEKNYSSSDFKSSEDNISKFFENEVNTNDIQLYTDNTAVKECSEDKSDKTESKVNDEQDEFGRWNYDNEKPLNGGDIGGGIIGYDTMGGSYATL
tara:strand:+ start:119 stop:730 length:612 start_codon:yes stop_codon:yes gene_type:complete